MFSSALAPLFLEFSRNFSKPTHLRFLLLMGAAILTVGRRTVSNMLRTAGGMACGHASSYHRFFSKRRWSLWPLARELANHILERYHPTGPVPTVVDDTVDGHKGKKVYGKGCHRDAVRSTHSYTAFRWGLKWVALCILVKFPWATRPWALPVLVALYRSKEWNRKHRRRHKTPPELARQLLAVLLHWFPERKFVSAGDGGFSTHNLAGFASRHRSRATLVGRFYPAANLYGPPSKRRSPKGGRPPEKGRKLPSPESVVKRSARTRLRVSWYGGGSRRVEVVSGTGLWYRAGEGSVPVRWVFVHDLSGTHRDEYFFSTDPTMTPKEIIETFTGRWSIEVTFQELRAYLGLETTRGWTEKTVLRAAPCLFGLYSVVALAYAALPKHQARAGRVQWTGKTETTFSDAITAVRRQLWRHWVFKQSRHAPAFSKLPPSTQAFLLDSLTPAA
jgi:hypothetical protein